MTESVSQESPLHVLLPVPCRFAFRGDVVVVALIVRDCYEAFVVYSFLTLILEHAGGDYNCIEQIKHLPPVSTTSSLPLCPFQAFVCNP